MLLFMFVGGVVGAGHAGSYQINFQVASTKAAVVPVITSDGVMANGGDVNLRYMNGDAAFILSQNMLALEEIIDKDKKHVWDPVQQAYLKQKSTYAQGQSPTEHDACLTSMLVACAKWDCKTKHTNVHAMLGKVRKLTVN